MVNAQIQEERVRHLNDKSVRDDDYVLYWMQQAQRAEYNHSLEYAAQASTSTVESLSMYTPITDSLTPIAEVATPKWSPLVNQEFVHSRL
jgi:hypothetical protein